MLIYDKSEHLTLYIWDRVVVIGGVEGHKMIEECGNAGLVSSYIKNDITRDPFHALIEWINNTIQLIEWINSGSRAPTFLWVGHPLQRDQFSMFFFTWVGHPLQ